MAELLKWQVSYLERIANMSNDELFTEYEEVSIPDDYDGDFTARGAWIKDQCYKLFVERLKQSGFLTPNYE